MKKPIKHKSCTAGFITRDFFFILLINLLISCKPFPRDAMQTYEEIKNSRDLKVGLLHAPPYVDLLSHELLGSEVALIQSFVKNRKIKGVAFIFFNTQEGFKALENKKIDLLLGGMKKNMPFKKVGYTRPFGQNRVIAISPGENRLLVELERYIKNEVEQGN